MLLIYLSLAAPIFFIWDLKLTHRISCRRFTYNIKNESLPSVRNFIDKDAIPIPVYKEFVRPYKIVRGHYFVRTDTSSKPESALKILFTDIQFCSISQQIAQKIRNKLCLSHLLIHSQFWLLSVVIFFLNRILMKFVNSSFRGYLFPSSIRAAPVDSFSMMAS